jgi:DnaK suppressor protein
MGLAIAPNSNRLCGLYGILERLRDETYQKIASFRQDQDLELLSSLSDEMDVARSTADLETRANLIERSQDRLRLIEQAQLRVRNGTYGKCEECHEDIPLERLKALPFALLCVDCQLRRGKSRGRWSASGIIEPYSSTCPSQPDLEAESRKLNSYGVMEAEDTHAEDPFGPIREPTAEPKRRRRRARENKD